MIMTRGWKKIKEYKMMNKKGHVFGTIIFNTNEKKKNEEKGGKEN